MISSGYQPSSAKVATRPWMLLDGARPLLWGAMGVFLLRGGGQKSAA